MKKQFLILGFAMLLSVAGAFAQGGTTVRCLKVTDVEQRDLPVPAAATWVPDETVRIHRYQGLNNSAATDDHNMPVMTTDNTVAPPVHVVERVKQEAGAYLYGSATDNIATSGNTITPSLRPSMSWSA